MNKAEKQEEIEFLSGCFTGSKIALCADYRGLDVAEMTELRKELRATGATARVVKNTLAKISIDKSYANDDAAEVEKLKGTFVGPCFVAFSEEDPVGPAKVFAKYVKEHEEKFSIKGGWFEGGFVDESKIKALSSLPSREELLAKLLSLINAPATQLLQVINAPGSQVVRLLEAQRANIEKSA